MTDIHETVDTYMKEAHDARQVNPAVVDMLQFELDENTILCNRTTSLYLAGNNSIMAQSRLLDADMPVFYNWLSENIYVVALDLRYNGITDKGALSLAKLLTKNTAIVKLNLMCNDIETLGAQYIAASLHKNRTLKHLRMTGNKIGDEGGVYFAEALQINETLEELDLADCDLGINSVVAMTTALHQNSSLKSLDVSRPILKNIEEDIFNHYCTMLRTNKTLKELHTRKHDMSHMGAASIAESLMHNNTLTYLDLSCNQITLGGAFMLASFLKKNTPLKTMDLSCNLISDQGAVDIATALALYNTNLMRLSVVKNGLTGIGMCSLAHCLFNNQTLKELYISGNKIDQTACIAFKKVVDAGRLELDNTDIIPYSQKNGDISMAISSNGINPFYYWGPTYGVNARPELSRYVKFPCPDKPPSFKETGLE